MLNRREFLKKAGIVGAGVVIAPSIAVGKVMEMPVVDAADIEWTPSSDMHPDWVVFGNLEPDSWVKNIYTKETMVSAYEGPPFTVSWDSEGVFKIE